MLLRHAAYYGSFALSAPLVLECLGEVGAAPPLADPSAVVAFAAGTITVAEESAMLGPYAGVPRNDISERFVTCHGTFEQYFCALEKRLAVIGDDADASIPLLMRECIPRSILLALEARHRVNAQARALATSVAVDGSTEKPALLPPINFATPIYQGQKLASIIVKETEVRALREAAVAAGATDVVVRLDDCRQFGAIEFLNAIPVGNAKGGFYMRSDHFRLAVRRMLGLPPAGVETSTRCGKCALPFDHDHNRTGSATRGSVMGARSRAACHASWCSRGNQKNANHNLVCDVICEMWTRLGGSAVADHQSPVLNGRVAGANPCILSNGQRVDLILFGAGVGGGDVYIDVSIACAECHMSFNTAIEAKEVEKMGIYADLVSAVPNCAFLPFVIGSCGGFGPCARKVWKLLNARAKQTQARDWRHSWTARSFCTHWRQVLSVRLMRQTAVGMIARVPFISRMKALGLESDRSDDPCGEHRDFLANGNTRGAERGV